MTSIGQYAFQDCTGLSFALIGNSVTSVGMCAFSGCIGLASVAIGTSVTSIGADAFSGCTLLNNIVIPNSVKRIGKSAFYDCRSLINLTLPNGETYIDEYAFMGCSGLKYVTIPKSVTSIGDGAFNGCININTICYESRSPINIYGTVFSSETYSIATLYVPKGKTSLYKSTIGWKNFDNISEFEEAQAFNSKGQIITDDIEEITSLIMDDSYHSIGDINGDNKVNVADIVEYANMVTINLQISNSSSVDVAMFPRIMFALNNNLIETWFGDKGTNITIKSGETKMIYNVKIANGKQLEGLHFARESELSNCLGNVFLYNSSSKTNIFFTEMIDPSTTFGDRKTYEIVLNSMPGPCPISIAEFLSANASNMLYCIQGIVTSRYDSDSHGCLRRAKFSQ